MRTSAALLPFAAVAFVSAVAAHEVDHHHQARHLQIANNGIRLEKLVRRQSLVDAALSVVDPAADTATTATTEASAAVTTSAVEAVTTSEAPVVEETTSALAETSSAPAATTTTTQAQVTTTSATTEAAATTTTQAQTTTPAAATSSSAKAPVTSASSAAESQASAISNDVETLTSTSINSASSQSGTASSSAASSSASSDEDNSSGGSGINKPTLIVIIVVASSIALVAAVWTIIRKTAFSPSRRFEAKLAPINFVTGRRDRDSFDGGADGILAHGRTGSVMSGQMSERYGPSAGYAASLGRSDSGKGSLRTTGGSIRGGREGAYPGSIPYNPQPTAYSGPAYYQQPYHGQQQQHFNPAQPGYPSEQAFGYSNLQRGASSRTDLSRGASARQPATPAGAYDYAAQQRQLAQSRSQSRGPY